MLSPVAAPTTTRASPPPKRSSSSTARPCSPTPVVYRRRVPITDAQLQSLGKRHHPDLERVLSLSYTWITAHDGDELVGFVNVAWDGGVHFFLLDTIVRPERRHEGIGSGLVQEAIAACHGQGDWLHVDSEEPIMRDFYEPNGFQPTAAGLVRLVDD